MLTIYENATKKIFMCLNMYLYHHFLQQIKKIGKTTDNFEIILTCRRITYL